MLRGYTIPLVDLADETFRQVIVDREKDQYLGHPTTALLDDGKTIITVYPKSHGRGAVMLKKSFDAGLTWTDRLPVPESWASSLEVPTIYKTVGPDGVKHLIMFSGLYPIRMAHSEDDGDTWSELTPIGDYGGIVAVGDIASLGGGHYLALFHDDGRFIRKSDLIKIDVYRTGAGGAVMNRILYSRKQPDGSYALSETWFSCPAAEKLPEDAWTKCFETWKGEGEGTYHLYQIESFDGGLTWGEPRSIAHHPVANLCEPGIVRSPDGRQLAVLLRENARKLNSHAIFSDNNGKTWSEPVELPGALTGDRHCIRYLKDGRLFISFRDTCLDTPTAGDWCGWIGTYEDIVQGREGQCRIRLMDNKRGSDCAYPGVEVLPDGTVVTTTYGHWTEGELAYVVSVRFHPDEIDEKLRTL
ncbi:MAG: exo-alpha-sialidase [Clostridia bacterium]|nr:exo-alpha-sialidase [Clostridia bacterium]